MAWNNESVIEPKQFICGHCGSLTGYNRGFIHKSSQSMRIYLCPVCDKPNIFLSQNQYPARPFGNSIDKLPGDLDKLYNDARNCISINAFTAAVMLCRKILMNFAVSEGAKENDSFLNYVDYLAENSFISPKAKDWVDHIRTKGNEANHEICLMEKQEAEDIILFTEILLKSNIEFPEKRQVVDNDEQTFQIKTNYAANQIAFRGEADLMPAIGIHEDGSLEQIYFGEFERIKSEFRFSKRDELST